MKIIIDYESSWRNSFLDGSNDKPLPKKGRQYISASSKLNPRKKGEKSTYKEVKVTHNTVMGILSRLIGDQRKLYQARQSDNYYFIDLENYITFEDKPSEINQEIVYLRNMSRNFDQNTFVGCIKLDLPSLNSSFSNQLWGVLNLDINELIDFLLDDKLSEKKFDILDPLILSKKIQDFKDVKTNKLDDKFVDKINVAIQKLHSNEFLNQNLADLFPKMKKLFVDGVYIKGETVKVSSLYCSALYVQLIRLSAIHDVSNIALSGISVNGITPKDFFKPFTGGKKMVYGNPYITNSFEQGIGKTKKLLTKANGQLEINIDFAGDEDREDEFLDMIENAGVSSFYLGKKGLAYVSDIILD